jgi:hypothetical protein
MVPLRVITARPVSRLRTSICTFPEAKPLELDDELLELDEELLDELLELDDELLELDEELLELDEELLDELLELEDEPPEPAVVPPQAAKAALASVINAAESAERKLLESLLLCIGLSFDRFGA